jgi:hypothetical protein
MSEIMNTINGVEIKEYLVLNQDEFNNKLMSLPNSERRNGMKLTKLYNDIRNNQLNLNSNELDYVFKKLYYEQFSMGAIFNGIINKLLSVELENTNLEMKHLPEIMPRWYEKTKEVIMKKLMKCHDEDQLNEYWNSEEIILTKKQMEYFTEKRKLLFGDKKRLKIEYGTFEYEFERQYRQIQNRIHNLDFKYNELLKKFENPEPREQKEQEPDKFKIGDIIYLSGRYYGYGLSLIGKIYDTTATLYKIDCYKVNETWTHDNKYQSTHYTQQVMTELPFCGKGKMSKRDARDATEIIKKKIYEYTRYSD